MIARDVLSSVETGNRGVSIGLSQLFRLPYLMLLWCQTSDSELHSGGDSELHTDTRSYLSRTMPSA